MDLFATINWEYWFTEQAIPVRVPFSDQPPVYIYVARIIVLLSGTCALTLSAAFACWCWGRWTGRPITLRD